MTTTSEAAGWSLSDIEHKAQLRRAVVAGTVDTIIAGLEDRAEVYVQAVSHRARLTLQPPFPAWLHSPRQRCIGILTPGLSRRHIGDRVRRGSGIAARPRRLIAVGGSWTHAGARAGSPLSEAGRKKRKHGLVFAPFLYRDNAKGTESLLTLRWSRRDSNSWSHLRKPKKETRGQVLAKSAIPFSSGSAARIFRAPPAGPSHR